MFNSLREHIQWVGRVWVERVFGHDWEGISMPIPKFLWIKMKFCYQAPSEIDLVMGVILFLCKIRHLWVFAHQVTFLNVGTHRRGRTNAR